MRKISFMMLFFSYLSFGLYGQTITNEQLLKYLKDFDSSYKSGFTASGTYKRGEMIIKWQFTSSNNELAYQEDVVEAFGPSALNNFCDLRRVYYSGNKYHARYDFVGTLTKEGKLTDWSRESAGLAKAGSLMIDDPDAPTYKLPLKQVWMSMGRGYSEHISDIVGIKEVANGLLSVTAIGTDISNREGAKWELLVDPDAAYMVREAKMYQDGKDKPSIYMKNSGTKWYGSLCVPEKNDWKAFYSRSINNNPYMSISDSVDTKLLSYAKKTMAPPFLVDTDFSDQRMVPEYRSQYKEGALFSGDNGDIGLDGLNSENPNPNSNIRPKSDSELSRPKINFLEESKIVDDKHKEGGIKHEEGGIKLEEGGIKHEEGDIKLEEGGIKQKVAIITLVISSLLLILFLFVKLRRTQK